MYNNNNSYTIKEDNSEPIEGSGTRLILHIKDDGEEYLDDFKIKQLCQKYSEFVSFPIEVRCSTLINICTDFIAVVGSTLCTH
jgi:HSP90 family molecular chaperone